MKKIDFKKIDLLKFSIILTNVFLAILILFVILLPQLVTWYVQAAGRHESLVTTIMVTCYPCAPFTGLILLSLRRLLKNISKRNLNNSENQRLLRHMSICAALIAIITLIAGRFYLPFYIVAATFIFLSVIIFTFKAIANELFTDK